MYTVTSCLKTSIRCRLVFINMEKNTSSNIIMVKAKVATVKTLSIPRLELSGTLLAAKLAHKIKDELHIPSALIFACSDSQVALSWISSCASKWFTFVSSRIGKIHSLFPPQNWHHDRSSDNPDDLATETYSSMNCGIRTCPDMHQIIHLLNAVPLSLPH